MITIYNNHNKPFPSDPLDSGSPNNLGYTMKKPTVEPQIWVEVLELPSQGFLIGGWSLERILLSPELSPDMILKWSYLQIGGLAIKIQGLSNEESTFWCRNT